MAMWQCKWRHLVAKLVTNTSSATWWPKLEPMQIALQFGTNASGATWWSNFELIQVEPCKRVNTLGPLCLWQCLLRLRLSLLLSLSLSD